MTDDYPSSWLRGVLEPCLLALVDRLGTTYGYELAAHLEQEGIGRIKGGSLYPALLRLEERGLVASEWQAGRGGPGRKCYHLTDRGRTELATATTRWASFAASVSGLLGTDVLDPGGSR